jgi:hypothetical protein
LRYARPSVPEDVEELIPNIPEQDEEDVIRGWERPAAEILREIFPMCDECFTIINDERVVGLFGVLSPDGNDAVMSPGRNCGNIWLMRGHGIENVALRFVRHGHKYIERWLKKYGCLTGYISKDYKKFIRWLEWEGFEFFDVGRGYFQCTVQCTVKSKR